MTITEYLRILYADDDADACYMVTTMLEFSDIKVTTTGTAAEAWQLAQIEHFDLYLLDSRFPDGCGLELCRRLRSFAPHTPILFYSGYAFETDKQKGLEAGAINYLTKPYLDDLAVTVQQTYEQNKMTLAGHYDNAYVV